MRLRKRYLPLAAVLGFALAAPQAVAAASEVKLEVNENCVQAAWPCWATEGSSQPASKVTIAAGGSVMYVDDKTAANLAWTGAAPACEAPVPIAPAPAKTGWEGKCVFSAPGAYKFESASLWFEYTKYEVVVEASTSPPPAPEGGSPPSAGSPGTSPTLIGESPSGSPLSGAPAVHTTRRGATVSGSLQISSVGAGDRLEVELLSGGKASARPGHKVIVGRMVSTSVRAGRLSFSVKLDAKARKALERHHRLALEVRIKLIPPHGKATIVIRSVTVHS